MFYVVAFDDIIVLGDMNFDCSTSNVGWNIFHSFCDDVGLSRADTFCKSDIEYKFFRESMMQHSVIDHIFVTDGLASSAASYYVVDEFSNFSDHLPVACDFKHKLHVMNDRPSNRSKFKQVKWRWDKADLNQYYFRTFELLKFIDVPTFELLNDNCDFLNVPIGNI